MKTKRILIVDDKATMRFLLSEILRPLGTEIETAENGKIAIKKLAEKKFDLIIIDYFICATNDLELLKGITEVYPYLAILVVNTNGFETEIVQKGALACIPRPLNPAQLQLISQLILKHQASSN